MNISVENLYKNIREVGKTVKSTKKLYIWEFVLNGNHHKIEVYHSKITGKKKLCINGQKMAHDKGYHSSFTYSFRIDKNFFNIVQLCMDKFELRIDNQPFDNLLKLQKCGKLKREIRSISQSSPKRNNDKIPQLVLGDHQPKGNKHMGALNYEDDFEFSFGKSKGKFDILNNIQEPLSIMKKCENRQIKKNRYSIDLSQNGSHQVNGLNYHQENPFELNKGNVHQYTPFNQNQIVNNDNQMTHNAIINSLFDDNNANHSLTGIVNKDINYFGNGLSNLGELIPQPQVNMNINTENQYNERNQLNLLNPNAKQKELSSNNSINVNYMLPNQNNALQMNQSSYQQEYDQIQYHPLLKPNLNINFNNYPQSHMDSSINEIGNPIINPKSENESNSFDIFSQDTNQKYQYNPPIHQQTQPEISNLLFISNHDKQQSNIAIPLVEYLNNGHNFNNIHNDFNIKNQNISEKVFNESNLNQNSTNFPQLNNF